MIFRQMYVLAVIIAILWGMLSGKYDIKEQL
jgi:nitrogen fixation-related uncharacterized protein